MQDVLVDALGAAEPVLVLLDNCEYVVDGATAMAHLVAVCPSVWALTTSRASLGGAR